ncbi:MAG: hypothetical protein ACHQF3_05945, partial [Alphaproteobacteria bacterium]
MTIARKSVAAAFLCASCALSGCWTVDFYGDRAVRYNLEAEQAQDQQVVLNVLRASKRRPLEFSGVQSVSGSATATGMLGVSWPAWLANHSSGTSIAPSAGVSGGPVFQVSVIDTQEFYQGILGPVPLSTVDFYLQRGLSPELVFD